MKGIYQESDTEKYLKEVQGEWVDTRNVPKELLDFVQKVDNKANGEQARKDLIKNLESKVAPNPFAKL